MEKQSFEKVICPKCGKVYAITKGSTKAFHCPGKNCHEMVNAKPATQTGKNTDAVAKTQE